MSSAPRSWQLLTRPIAGSSEACPLCPSSLVRDCLMAVSSLLLFGTCKLCCTAASAADAKNQTPAGVGFCAPFMMQAGALVHIYMDGSALVTTGAVEMGNGAPTDASIPALLHAAKASSLSCRHHAGSGLLLLLLLHSLTAACACRHSHQGCYDGRSPTRHSAAAGLHRRDRH